MKGGIRKAAAVVPCAIVISAAAVFLPASPAGAVTLPIPHIPGTNLGGGNCKPPPPVRSSATGISAMFDGTPADTGGMPATSLYERYGVHPFSWAVYDPGCAGDVAQPTATLDTYLGDQALGLATDLIALSNGVHNLVSHPTWLGAFDRMEANATQTLKSHVFDLFLPLSLIIIGLLVISRSNRGNMAAALRMVGWGVLVMAVVAIVASAPVRIGHAADQIETSGVNAVNGALAGTYAGPSAAGSLEVDSILYPAWLRGEVGSDTSRTALQWGPELLDGQAYKWDELQNGTPISKTTAGAKNKEFEAAASAVGSSDPGAYHQLTGQAGGRIGAGIIALVGALVTVPFRLIADLLVVASLLLLRLEVIFLPLIGVVAIHHRFRAVLTKGVVAVTFAALINAFVFSAAAAVNVLLTGFMLNPSNGIPIWFGLLLSGLVAVVLFAVLRPFRRLTRMVNANEITHSVSHTVSEQLHSIKNTVTKAGLAKFGGPAGMAAAAAMGNRESTPDHDHDEPDVSTKAQVPESSPPDSSPPEPIQRPVSDAPQPSVSDEPSESDKSTDEPLKEVI